MIEYLARDIQTFEMYCVNGTSRSSLLIESTDSMIIESTDSMICVAIVNYKTITFLGLELQVLTIWNQFTV